MTNHWIDIKNANCVLIMGSNCAEHHPVSFKWVMAAKDNGATLIHVDPKFSRTSARCDFHVPLRSGSDVAFLGGMINYIIENKLYLEEYVHLYTNADFVVGKDYYFKDGVFSGLDPEKRRYDASTWAFEKDASGAIVTDPEWKNPRCVFNLLKEHYSRYTLDNVSSVTGVSKENILRVYKAFTATGKPDKAGTIMYALGWTQHTNGVQIIRCSTLVQLLLGNIGVAGGGINALRGEPNVQGSTDQALLYDSLPGYIGMPRANQHTLEQYLKANTPTTKFKKSINWKSNTPKYMVSLLKAWFGEAATKDNEFGYQWLPKLEPFGDYSYYTVIDNALHDRMRGGFVFGTVVDDDDLIELVVQRQQRAHRGLDGHGLVVRGHQDGDGHVVVVAQLVFQRVAPPVGVELGGAHRHGEEEEAGIAHHVEDEEGLHAEEEELYIVPRAHTPTASFSRGAAALRCSRRDSSR